MTDQLLVPNSTEEPPMQALAPSATSVQVSNDSFGEADYSLSDSDTEKPVLLELGGTANERNCQLQTYNESLSYQYTSHSMPQYIPCTSGSTEISNTFGMSEAHGITSSMALYHGAYMNSNLPTVPVHMPMFLPQHIPQPVCNWQNTENSNHVINKGGAEIGLVPPPAYLSYIGAHEHNISKEINPSWKDRALQIEKGIQY